MMLARKGKKLLSLLLALVMLLGLLPVSAMAADVSSASQIEDDTQRVTTYWDAQGNQLEDAAELGGDAKVAITKSIQGTDAENQFQVTLTVDTVDTVTTHVQETGAHVVLVMDVSNSMMYCAGCGAAPQTGWDPWIGSYTYYDHDSDCPYRNSTSNPTTRLDAAKDAAESFVNAMLGENAAPANEIGVVSYGRVSHSIQSMTSNKTQLIRTISYLQIAGGGAGGDDGGTNIQAGLAAAQNMLAADDFAGPKFIVILSDGVPTYSNQGDGATWDNSITDPSGDRYGFRLTSFGNNVVGSGRSWQLGDDEYNLRVGYQRRTVTDNVLPTLSQAYLTRSAGIEVYSVLMGSEDTFNDGDYAVANHVMRNVASADGEEDADIPHYSTVADGNINALAELFRRFSQTIIEKTNVWYVDDPMSKDAVFGGFVDPDTGETLRQDPAGAGYDTETATMHWDLQDRGITPISLGDNQWRYQLSYTVTLNNTQDGFAANTYVPLNNTTTLVYSISSEQGGTVGEQLTATFTLPRVMGLAGELTVNKRALQDHDGSVIFGYKQGESEELRNAATFTLTHSCGCPGDAWSQTLQTVNNTLTFTNIPSGHTYTLTEVVPEGYDQSLAETYTVVVSKVGNTNEVAVTVYDSDNQIVSSNGKLEVTNTLEAGSVTVVKTWNDQNGAAGTRPEAITVTLTDAGGNSYQAVLRADLDEDSDNNTWTVTFDEIPVIDVNTGSAIAYTVAEQDIPGYTLTASAYQNGVATLTNTLDNETSVTVNKEWITPDDMEQEIEVQLYQNGVEAGSPVALNSGNGWTYTWSELPIYADGVAIDYDVREITDLEGVVSRVTEEGNTFTITNMVQQVEDLSITGNKVWNDAGGAGNQRPADLTSVEVTLTGTAGGDVVLTQKTNLDETGAFQFTNLPKYDIGVRDDSTADTGEEIQYTVSDSVDGYLSEPVEVVFDEATNTATVTLKNTLDTSDDTAKLTVEKVWVDGDDYDETRPASVTLQVWRYVQGLDSYAPRMIDEFEFAASTYDAAGSDGDGTADTVTTWTGSALRDAITVPLYYTAEDGTVYAYTYYVVELNGAGDALTSADNELSGQNGAVYVATWSDPVIPAQTGDATLTVTNTLSSQESERTSITVTKTWIDPFTDTQREALGIRAYITLSSEDGGYTEMFTLTANGSKTFTVPKYDENGTIHYTVSETVETGESGVAYTQEIAGYDITNTIAQEELHITLNKVWDDSFAGDTALRPDVTLVLLQDGQDYQTVSLGEMTTADHVTYTTALSVPRYDLEDGHEYVYSVNERMTNLKDYSYLVNVDTGVDTDEDGVKDAYTVTNTFDPGVAYVNGTKTWYAPAGVELPESIQVNIYRDGALYTTETIDNPDDGSTLWNYAFRYDKFAPDGHAYVYTVEEVVPDGFTASYDGYDIVNTHDEYGRTASFSVTKYWYGPEEARPADGLTVSLYRSTTENDPAPEYVQGILLFAPAGGGNVWTGSFGQWPLYNADRERYYYTVRESGETGGVYTYGGVTYNVSYDQDTFTITNTNAAQQEAVDVTVNKLWDNRLDEATEDVRVYLYADGSLVAADGIENPVKLTAENGYTYTWSGLPKYEADMNGNITGDAITYTVQEVGATYAGTVNGAPAYAIQYGDGHYQVTYGTDEATGALTITNYLISTDVYRYRVELTYITLDEDGNVTHRASAYVAADGVSVTDAPADIYGAGGQQINVDLDGYATYGGNTYTFSSGWLDGADRTTDFAFNLDQTGHLYTVSLTYVRTAEGEDPGPDPTPEGPNLTLTKDATSSVTVGQNITYTLTVGNNGDETARNVTVTDRLPEGVTFVSASSEDYDPDTGVWTVGDLAAGARATLTITATADATGTVVNTATADADNADPVEDDATTVVTDGGNNPGGGGDRTVWHTVTVRYLEEGTERELHSAYTLRVQETHAYDVTEQTERTISGYTLTDVTGDPITMDHIYADQEIIVWYTNVNGTTNTDDDNTPPSPTPNPGDTTIDDGETPLNPGPDTPASGGTGTEDGGVPQGNLPQTGAVAAPVNPTITAGLLALAMSMAAVGLVFTFGRKKGEDEN